MTIVILDGHPLNPGDLSWESIERQASVTIHAGTPPEQIVSRAAEADIVMTNKVPLTAETLARLPRLKLICVLATGVNVVDTAAARARGVPVCNVPAYSTMSVAQTVFALLLELCQHVGVHDRMIHEGEWARRGWSFWVTPQVELAGKTLGIIGYGKIGEQVAAVGRALGMKVLAYSRTRKGGDVEWGTIDEVFAGSDVVSLHVPLTPETRGLVNTRTLGLMRAGSYLINTARGAVVMEADLAAALRSGKLAGAGLDVASVEPINSDNPLLTAPNCVMTPHLAWATLAARRRCIEIAAGNVEAFLEGNPRNVVN
jgi:glycerate dehydrogenase